MFKYQNINVFLAVPGILLLAGLFACVPKVDNGGYVTQGDIRSKITVGKSTREDVQNALGSPSTQSSFGDESWYYITNRKEAVAFMKPEVTEQNVARIEFDKAGYVSTIQQYDKNSGQDIEIAGRETPTEGHTLGFFEQILGNLGRFNAPDGGKSNPVPGGRSPGGSPR